MSTENQVEEQVIETAQTDVLANANVAPESFDWESFESGLNEEDRKEKAELEQMYDTTLEDLNENEV
ncbi:MAG TPA: 30S ribosomal protein S1, partial [Faecalibacter sp.]